MKRWLVPVAVFVLVVLVAGAAAVLPAQWAFFAIATCIVVGLGAAPVAFAVYTRRVEVRRRESERRGPGNGLRP